MCPRLTSRVCVRIASSRPPPTMLPPAKLCSWCRAGRGSVRSKGAKSVGMQSKRYHAPEEHSGTAHRPTGRKLVLYLNCVGVRPRTVVGRAVGLYPVLLRQLFDLPELRR
jgi:hypothetical protein